MTKPTMRASILLFSALLLANQGTVVLATDLCEPCSGGEIDPTLSFDGVACTRWIALAGNSAADSSECAFDRMIGVWFCGCPVPPEVDQTCTLCNNGANTYTGDKPFPDSSVTCDQIASVPALDGERTCNELSFMGQFCGCEETESTKCQICPNGLKPANPDNVFWHTEETCKYVEEVMSLSPLESCDMFVSDMMVDIPSYCGCPGSEAPFSCSLCPEGQRVADESKEAVYANGSTCGDFDSYLNFVTDETFCEFLQEVIAPDCCEDFAVSREYQCTFCPGGESVEVGDRAVFGSDTTCEELATREGTNDCSALFQTNLDSLVDTRIFCGCPGENPIGACDFCPEGEILLYPNKTIALDNSIATCSDYAALADSTSDDGFCSAIGDVAVTYECCGPAPMGFGQQNVTVEEIEMCSLCPSGLPAEDPNRPFIGTEYTCADYEQELKTLPVGDECDAIQKETAATFNPAVYCQCPGVETEAVCRFCPEGQVLTDPTAFISDISTTCSQMADIARSTTDETFCDSLQRVGEYYCCGDPEFARRLDQSFSSKPMPVFLKPELRPLHFAALKALDTIQASIAKTVEMPNNSKLDPYEN